MLQFIILLKAVNEIVLLALIAQGLIYVLAGQQCERNVFYSIVKAITAPVLRVSRFIAPRFVPDRHIGFVALFFLVCLEAVLTLAKFYHITQNA